MLWHFAWGVQSIVSHHIISNKICISYVSGTVWLHQFQMQCLLCYMLTWTTENKRKGLYCFHCSCTALLCSECMGSFQTCLNYYYTCFLVKISRPCDLNKGCILNIVSRTYMLEMWQKLWVTLRDKIWIFTLKKLALHVAPQMMAYLQVSENKIRKQYTEN